MTGKVELRREARRRLGEPLSDERRRLGARIAARVWTVPEIGAARTILLYAALAEEVPTRGIAAEARARGIEVVYPRCLPIDGEMSLHLVGSETELASGRFGVPEPAPNCPEIGLSHVDVALVPGLGWDRQGYRLGRGAGYYDRLLGREEWSGFSCGLFFSFQEFPHIPFDAWDHPLDAVLTDLEVWRS